MTTRSAAQVEAHPEPYLVRRVPVAAEPLVDGRRCSYADAFEVRLDQPDGHTAEQWMRAALEQAAPAVRRVIRFVHGRVAGFGLSPEPDSLLGWHTLTSTRDVLHLATQGPGLRAEIVARRRSLTTATVSTFLFYEGRRAALLWRVIGPLHRRIAPYLLRRAAAHLTRTG